MATATALDAPADTTMMRIVHDALRRDLARAGAVLGGDGRAGVAQRRAVGAHLGWMMRFLHGHHASEDAGLYPLALQRVVEPSQRVLLERMGADHDAIATAVDLVAAAGARLSAEATDDAARHAAAAVDALEAVLLPHLRDEEVDVMPVVSGLVTEGEWQALEKEHNLDGKRAADLAFEGHWLIDGASDADRATVVGVVPPVLRFVLLHGFARRYRRHAAACWGGDARPSRRVQLEGGAAVTVAAEVDDVWAVVRDVTRVGEWSHECVGAEWLGGATAAVPGARFRGRNRSGAFRWGRVCEVVTAEPHELVWITVPTTAYPDSCEWRLALAPAADGRTTITEQFRVIRGAKVLAVLYGLVIPAHRDRTAALVEDLQRLGAVAARSRTPA